MGVGGREDQEGWDICLHIADSLCFTAETNTLYRNYTPTRNKRKLIYGSSHQQVTLFFKSVSSVAQSCLTLCDPMDCSLPDSSVHGILKEWSWSGFPLPYSHSNSSSALSLLHNLWQVTECLHVSVSSCVKRRKVIVSASQHSFRDLIANK